MKKITRWAEKKGVCGEEQSGFRREQNGMANVYIIKELTEINKGNDKHLCLGFTDT